MTSLNSIPIKATPQDFYLTLCKFGLGDLCRHLLYIQHWVHAPEKLHVSHKEGLSLTLGQDYRMSTCLSILQTPQAN